MKLTIFFDGSFWCGLIEATDNEKVKVVKYVFGAEPKADEVFTFVNHTLPELLAATPSVKQKKQAAKVKRINPKRLQRLVNQEKKRPVYSTKAQVALQETHAIQKQAKAKRQKANKQVEQTKRFQQKQVKKREKKKGH